MRKYLYKLSGLCFSPLFRCLLVTVSLVFLSGCDKIFEDSSLSGNGNYEGQSSCWQLLLLKPIISMVSTLFNNGAEKAATGGANLILIAFAVWMALKMLKILSSFKEENIGEVLTEIGQKLFICVTCAFIVNGHIIDALNVTLIPLYQTIMELGSEALDDTPSMSLGDYGIITFKTPFDKPTCPVIPKVVNTLSDMQAMIRNSSGCLVCAINDRLSSGIKIGIWMVSTLHVMAMIIGLILIIIFTIAKFGFVLFIVDALFRINFAVFLLPILIMGIPFKYTRKWSKHGALMFLNSSGVMMFMGLLVAVSTKALEKMIKDYEAANALNETGMEGMSFQLLGILMIALLLINIPAMAVALADKFIEGGGGLEFQKKVTQFVMNTMKKMGKAVIDSVSSSATDAVTTGMEKYEKVREAADNIKQMKQSASEAVNNFAGYNDD